MADNISETFRARIRKMMETLADDVATGSALAQDAGSTAMRYATMVGKIEGLALAERALLDIYDEIEEQEKLDT